MMIFDDGTKSSILSAKHVAVPNFGGAFHSELSENKRPPAKN